MNKLWYSTMSQTEVLGPTG